MKIIRLYMNTNIIDGDVSRVVWLIYDTETEKRHIDRDTQDIASEYFEDHAYLSPDYDYDYETGFESEEAEANYFDSCWYEVSEVELPEMYIEAEVEYGSVENAEIYDFRHDEEKGEDEEWH